MHCGVFVRTEFRTFDALVQHHASTLEEFSVAGVREDEDQVVRILQSCPRLRKDCVWLQWRKGRLARWIPEY